MKAHKIKDLKTSHLNKSYKFPKLRVFSLSNTIPYPSVSDTMIKSAGTKVSLI